MWDFVKKWLVLPIGILLQVVGYVETTSGYIGLPKPFLFSSAGFLLATVSLVWFGWFSEIRTHVRKRIALVALAVLSLSYYAFVQYEMLVYAERQIIEATIDIETADALIKRDAREALLRVNRVAERVPDIAAIYNLRGRALHKLGRYDEAYENFKAAARLDPTTRQYEYNIAVALRSLCDYKGAKKLLTDYTEKYKTDFWGFYDHGVISHILGEHTDALQDYNIVIHSNNKDAPIQSALFNAAVVHASRAAKSAQDDERFQELSEMFLLLDQAIKLGRTERLQIIREALVPISERESQCAGFYATDDLTTVAKLPQFKEWLKRYE